jgi:hypothetical protein
MIEDPVEVATQRISPPGLEDETRSYIRRIVNSDNETRVELVMELSEIIHKDTDAIMRVFYDMAADNI